MNIIPVIRDDKELLCCGVCRVRIPNTIDTKKWAAELSQVTPLIAAIEDGEFAFYRNIMEESNFPFHVILQEGSDIGKALLRYFGLNSLHKIYLDDAFCVHYNEDQYDTSGARHTDPSDITVNMCLEKMDDTQGSQVLFHGTKPLIKHEQGHDAYTAADVDKFLVDQEPGFATIHWGAHPHETTPLKQGKRTNIILTYCYRDASKSEAHKRACYFT